MIHPTALISPEAIIHPSVEIGPFSLIEGPVHLAENCKIGAHVWLKGDVTIGEHSHIGYGSIIGADPQDRSFDPTISGGVRIGARNQIREYVTIHRNTKPGEFTRIGDDNFLMTGVHLAHDVHIGDYNNIANNALLAGHVQVGNRCFIGGGAVIHQFLRIGDLAVLQGNSAISQDVPPFCLVHGHNHVSGLNVVGLRRNGFSNDERQQLKQAYKLVFNATLPLRQLIEATLAQPQWHSAARQFLAFYQGPTKKGVLARE